MSALTFGGTLIGCAADVEKSLPDRAIVSEQHKVASADRLTPMLKYKVESLANIGPSNPLEHGSASQVLSLFGREDLIATLSRDYQANSCAGLTPRIDVYGEIERRARLTSIVIVNESHEVSRHRGFIVEIAGRLRPLGYDVLAMEALANPPPGIPDKFLPKFISQPDLPFVEDEDGYYVSEAGFGRLARRAKALGYRLLPYEANDKDRLAETARPDQRIAAREEGQARNLAAFLRAHPGKKLLVHVGYSHAKEVPQADGTTWMAARLKEKTGIDPLTISQTTCRSGAAKTRLAALPAGERSGTFDMVVDHPPARFIRGRPAWRQLAGDRPVTIPPALRPSAGWRVIEARPMGEPDTSVPVDRVAIRANDDIALMLPPGRYYLRAIDAFSADRNRKP